jgi:PAS domain S-box-containing protein
MFLPVVFSAYYGGFGPGLSSVLVTLTLGNFLFVPPAFSLRIPQTRTALALLAFSLTGIAISVLGEFAHRSLAQAVTEAEIRKAAQANLQANEERLRIAESVMSAGMWDWDILHDVVYFSDAYRRLYDYSLDYVPTREAWIASVHPADRDRAVRQVDDLFRQHLHHWTMEFRVHTATGRMRWMASKGQVYYTADGRPARMVGLNIDITPQKALEQSPPNHETPLRVRVS